MIRYSLIALALTTVPVVAQESLSEGTVSPSEMTDEQLLRALENDEIGRFQATGTSLSDGSPGLWVLDTVFGRVAMCSYQNALEQGGTTSSSTEWSISEVTCSAFTVPKKGPWDKYQKE